MNFSIASALMAVLLVSVSQADAFSFSNCATDPSSAARVDSITVSHCPARSGKYCQLKKGIANMSVDFKLKKSLTSALTTIHESTKGKNDVIPVNLSDACHQGIRCPTKAGKVESLTAQFNTNDLQNNTPINIKMELKDQRGATLVCIQFPAKVVS